MDGIISIIYWYVLFINIIGLYIMKTDKQRARKQKYRIKENTIWKISFLGGAIGTFLGMRMFRHKTKHKSFAWGLPLLAIAESLLFLWIYQVI